MKGGENTKSKRLIIILSILFLFTIGAVSASEDASTDFVSVSNESAVSIDNAQEIISEETDGTFTDLLNDLDGKTGVVDLTRNYKYVSEDGDLNKGIKLSNSIVLNGNNHTIDGSDVARIFIVEKSDIVINNVTFVNYNINADNSKYKDNDDNFQNCGAAILVREASGNAEGTNLKVTNCNFYNGSNDVGYGAAIFTRAQNTEISNCKFENNADVLRAAAICLYNANPIVDSCIFINNTAGAKGGAIYTGSNAVNCQIRNSNFTNNKANSDGGAAYIESSFTNVIGCNFDDNSALIAGGAIHTAGSAVYSQIRNSNFTNNKANYSINNTRGGAGIFVDSDLTTISDCVFKENNAAHTGGAIFVHARNNVSIDNSTFINNTAFAEAGAVYFFYCENSTVGNCNFTQNGALCPNGDSYGGAIRVHEGTNTYIHDSNFTGNYVNHNAGGAIEYHSDGISNGTIENCNFENNTANSDGGAIYAHCKGELDIIGCNFTNNNVIDNQNVKSGGAVLINLKTEDNGTKAWNNALKTKILNSNFINNTAPVMGGALCLRSNDKGITFEENIIENCTFTGNNATWGSAIFLYTGVSVNITNVVFGKNRANSTSLDIAVDKEKSVYPSNVTLSVIFKGKDNIVNAIWNGGHHSKNDRTPQGPSNVYLKNITYEVYHDGELKTVQVYQDKLENPVNGYIYGDSGVNIWQDNHENAQNITIEIYSIEEDKMVFSISAPLTEINGSMSNKQLNLKPGNYTAKAYHKTDAYYTEASDSVDFEIISNVELSVNKTADVNVVGNNSLVNYTITVENDGVCNASDVKIIDYLPENLTYSGEWGIIKSNGAKIEQVSDLEWIVSKITNGTDISIWYIATVNTNIAGNITNVVNVTCKENKTKVSDNESIEVVPVVLTVNKTVDVNLTGNNTEVTFKIVVNNTSKVNATVVKVVDELPEGLEYVTSTKDEDGMEFDISDDQKTLTWIISEMNDDPVELFVTVRTALIGNLTNNVTVTSKENDTPVKDNETVEVIPVVLTVNKTVDVNLTANNTEVTFKIVVNNTSKVKATEVTVVDELPESLTYVDSTRSYEGVEFSISDDLKTLTWVISEMNDDPVELFVTVRTALVGYLTNNVTVTSKENKTPVKDNETVEVVPIILNVTKTANVTVVGKDAYVTYTIVVNNTSKVNATQVVVIDSLPGGLEYISSSPKVNKESYSVDISEDEKTLTLTLPKLKGIVELYITVKTTDFGNYTNNVTVTSKENKTPSKDNETIEVVPVILTVEKTADVNLTVNNTEVTFTIVVNNTSKLNATEVRVVDVLPDGLTYVDSTKSGDGVDFSISDDNKTLTWIVDELTDSVEFYVTVRTALVGNLTNNVTVTSKENDTPVSDNETVEVIPVVLTVDKTVDINMTSNNTEVTFTIVVNNTSKLNATKVTVVDSLPDGLTYVDSTKSGDGVDFSISDDNKTLTWIVDELTDSVEFYVTVRTALVGNLTNNVTVTSNENDTPVKDNETVEVVPVVLTVVKTANVTNVSLGGLVEFTMTITNEGLVDATNVNVTDILDSAFELQSIGNETYLKYSDAQKIVWNIPSLAAGDSAAVSVIVKVIKEGTFLNVVAVNCEENKTDVSNKTNVTSLPVVDLKINKTVDKNNVTVGDEVIYTITVINLGPSNATNVNVTENMIGNVEITDVDAEVGEYKDGIWYIGALSNGAIAKLTLTVKTLAVGIVQNIVSVNSSEDDNNNSNNKYPCENVTVNPAPSLVEGVNLTVYYGDPIVVDYTSTNATNVTYEIIDKDGKVVANGTVGPDGSIPVEQLPVGNYTVNWTTIVDENHIPATNVSTIEVLPIPTTVTIGNITGYPGENVTIPINVTTIDKKPFNGNVSVIMPDNSTQIVKVVNGTGNITWHIPEDYDPNRYPDVIRFPGDDVYEPSNGTGIIEVVKIPTHITVGNVTTFPGMEVTIPINVTADDGIPFNGNVTITFPDGTVKTVEIINGTGSTTWFVPSDYAPENYPDNVKFSGNGKYLPSEGNGTITVLEVPVPVDTNETVDNVTIPPVPGNHTHPIDEGKPPVKSPVKPKAVAKKALTKTGLAKYETGNPILALIMVLALFGINIRRRKQN